MEYGTFWSEAQVKPEAKLKNDKHIISNPDKYIYF